MVAGWVGPPLPVHMLLCPPPLPQDDQQEHLGCMCSAWTLDFLASRTVGSDFLFFVNYSMSRVQSEQPKTDVDFGRAEGFLRSDSSVTEQGRRVILELGQFALFCKIILEPTVFLTCKNAAVFCTYFNSSNSSSVPVGIVSCVSEGPLG